MKVCEYTTEGVTYHYQQLSPKEVELLGYQKQAEVHELLIPSSFTIEGVKYKVAQIAEGAFVESPGVWKIHIPDSVTSIGEYAFYRCEQLEEIGFGSGLRVLPKEVCRCCSRLTNVFFGGRQVEEIGESAFWGCSSLEAVSLPTSVKKMGEDAFANCAALETVVQFAHQGEQEHLFADAFDQEGVYHPVLSQRLHTVETNKEWTYEICEAYSVGTPELLLQTYHGDKMRVTIPKNIGGIPVTSVAAQAFYAPEYKMIETLVWQSHLILPYTQFFLSFTMNQFPRLRAISFPKVREISTDTCSNCRALQEFTCPEGYPKSIRQRAFYGCQSFHKIVIPQCVTEIEKNAFANCSNLKFFAVKNKAIAKEKVWEAIFGDDRPNNDVKIMAAGALCTLLQDFAEVESQPLAPKSARVFVTGAGEIQYTLKEKTLEVTLLGLQKAGKKVVLPKEICGFLVTGIGDGALAFHQEIEELEIGENITKIGCMAIYGCQNLQIIHLTHQEQAPVLFEDAIARNPQGVIFVENAQIKEGLNKRNAQIPIFSLNGEECCGQKISYRYELGTLKRLTIEGTGELANNKKTEAENTPWYGIRNFVEELVLQGVSSVGSYLFEGFPRLKKVIFASEVEKIAPYAFANCTSLTELVHIPESLTKIYSHAFYNCTALKEVVFPPKLELIGSFAFFGTAIERVEIPETILSIGEAAFMECRNLKEIYLKTQNRTVIGNKGKLSNHIFYNVGEGCTIYTKIRDIKALENNYNHNTQVNAPIWGKCGKGLHDEPTDEVIWSVAYDHVLEIMPKNSNKGGQMMDFDNVTPPWLEHDEQINQLVIHQGVTSIGEGAFYGMGFTKVVLQSVQEIGAYAFAQCHQLQEVDLSQDLSALHEKVFFSCNNLSVLQYMGTRMEWKNVKISEKSLDHVNFVQCKDGEVFLNFQTPTLYYRASGYRRSEKYQSGLLGEGGIAGEESDELYLTQLELYWFGTENQPGKGLLCQAHIENIGDRIIPFQNGTYQVGSLEKRRLEAICLEFLEPWTQKYLLFYRVRLKKHGWQEWVQERDWAGTKRQSLPITAIQIERLGRFEGMKRIASLSYSKNRFYITEVSQETPQVSRIHFSNFTGKPVLLQLITAQNPQLFSKQVNDGCAIQIVGEGLEIMDGTEVILTVQTENTMIAAKSYVYQLRGGTDKIHFHQF